MIKGLPYPEETELYLRSGKSLIAYGMVRKGDLYNYIHWDVPMGTLKEINNYFSKEGLELENIVLEWVKGKFAEQGNNIHDPKIIKQFRNKI